MLLAADLPPLDGEQRRKEYKDSLCPFMGGKCRGHDCELFVVYHWKVAFGRRPWLGCALRALPLVLKGEL